MVSIESTLADIFHRSVNEHIVQLPANKTTGSYGTFPKAISQVRRHYLDVVEQAPDPYFRYNFGAMLDDNRAAVAEFVDAPLDTIVFIPNATTAINVVLRDLQWDKDGKDEILYFNTIYGRAASLRIRQRTLLTPIRLLWQDDLVRLRIF